jgi:hypothetical protein
MPPEVFGQVRLRFDENAPPAPPLKIECLRAVMWFVSADLDEVSAFAIFEEGVL